MRISESFDTKITILRAVVFEFQQIEDFVLPKNKFRLNPPGASRYKIFQKKKKFAISFYTYLYPANHTKNMIRKKVKI